MSITIRLDILQKELPELSKIIIKAENTATDELTVHFMDGRITRYTAAGDDKQ